MVHLLYHLLSGLLKNQQLRSVTNKFQVEWHPTREPAEALATMDLCFASLTANDRVSTEILKKAYGAWVEARLALHPFANETHKDNLPTVINYFQAFRDACVEYTEF